MTAPPFAPLEAKKQLRRIVQLHAGRPVVLVGSYARNIKPHALSDIDVLVVDTANGERDPANVQIISVPLNQFRKRVSEGDDFAQWALRFGIPISGRAEWQSLRDDLLATAPWPSSEASWIRAERALRYARNLLAMGDEAAATEQAILGVSHVGRALLLEQNVFPLSRPELPQQLASISDRLLAETLTKLLTTEVTYPEIAEAIALATGRLPAPSAKGPG